MVTTPPVVLCPPDESGGWRVRIDGAILGRAYGVQSSGDREALYVRHAHGLLIGVEDAAADEEVLGAGAQAEGGDLFGEQLDLAVDAVDVRVLRSRKPVTLPPLISVTVRAKRCPHIDLRA
jgi:hypothetical protein